MGMFRREVPKAWSAMSIDKEALAIKNKKNLGYIEKKLKYIQLLVDRLKLHFKTCKRLD